MRHFDSCFLRLGSTAPRGARGNTPPAPRHAGPRPVLLRAGGGGGFSISLPACCTRLSASATAIPGHAVSFTKRVAHFFLMSVRTNFHLPSRLPSFPWQLDDLINYCLSFIFWKKKKPTSCSLAALTHWYLSRKMFQMLWWRYRKADKMYNITVYVTCYIKESITVAHFIEFKSLSRHSL